MELGFLKPLLTTLLLPPMLLLLLALLGLILIGKKSRGFAFGKTLALLSLALLWLVSCHGTGVWLSRLLLPPYEAVQPAQLKTSNLQAIVVLGGGLVPNAPEYGQAQLSGYSASRLRYGIYLSRLSGLPILFSGGVGWGNSNLGRTTEAEVAARVALQDYGVTLRWREAQSRDTAENAVLSAAILRADKVKRIALVTDAWHMPRAQEAFERAGLQVTPAPIGFILPAQPALLAWLPSPAGLSTSQMVLKEWLAQLAARRLIN